MPSEAAYKWIEKGYEHFALLGADGLKIEKIAREVNTSKSSFYHLFLDVQEFQTALLTFHIERAQAIAQEAKSCKNFETDFVQVVKKNKSDMLFNRQLRIKRNNLSFQLCFEHANALVKHEILPHFASFVGYSHDLQMASNLFALMEDSFYSRVTEDAFHDDFLIGFISQFKSTIQDIVRFSGMENK